MEKQTQVSNIDWGIVAIVSLAALGLLACALVVLMFGMDIGSVFN